MFGIPTGLFTGTKDYRDALDAQPDSPTAKRDVTVAFIVFFYLPLVAGIGWAWLHDYGLIEYWLSVALVQAAGLAVVCMLALAKSLVRLRRR